MDNLPELKDIHLPPEIGLFPLGYGAVTLVIIFVLLIVLTPYFRYLYLQSKKKYALDVLNALKQNNMSSICKISELIRRICKIKHKKAVALYGAAWADFLNKTSDEKISLSQMNILVNAPYAPATLEVNQKDFSALKHFAQKWVEANL